MSSVHDRGLSTNGRSPTSDLGRRFQMASLIYSAIASLDGYVEDEQGQFDWAAPDEEVHAFVNDLGRPVGTYLYGRRMYETMVYWETDDDEATLPGTSRRSGARPKRSSTPGRCRRCPAREPESSRLRRRGDQAAEGELAIRHHDRRRGARRSGDRRGPGRRVAAAARAGSRRPWQASAAERRPRRLEMLDERRFQSGAVFLRYRARS